MAEVRDIHHSTGHTGPTAYLPIDQQVMIDDAVVLLCGVVIGLLVAFTWMSYKFRRVYISPKSRGKNMNIMRIKNEKTGEEALYINPETF